MDSEVIPEPSDIPTTSQVVHVEETVGPPVDVIGEPVLYANGDSFTGQVMVGIRTGFGKYVYANGDVYNGYFVDDKKQGIGKLEYCCSIDVCEVVAHGFSNFRLFRRSAVTIMESLKVGFSLVVELIVTRMVTFILAIGQKVVSMDMAYIITQTTADHWKELGVVVSLSVVNGHYLMAMYSLVVSIAENL